GPEPGRVRGRDAPERTWRRPECQLVVRLARRRPPLGYLLPRPAPVLGARDPDRAQPDPAPPAAGDDLVPPAHGSRLALPSEQRRRPDLRPRRRHALLPPPLARRYRHQLAEPPPARNGIVHGRASRRRPHTSTGRRSGACGARARRGPAMSASPADERNA